MDGTHKDSKTVSVCVCVYSTLMAGAGDGGERCQRGRCLMTLE